VKLASQELDASVGASGPHDFAVRISAARLASLPRPPHPAPNVRDDRDTPLMWDGMAMDIVVIWVFGKSEYFFVRGWTGNSQNSPSGKSGNWRNLASALLLSL